LIKGVIRPLEGVNEIVAERAFDTAPSIVALAVGGGDLTTLLSPSLTYGYIWPPTPL
jgi:hypothetical protein